MPDGPDPSLASRQGRQRRGRLQARWIAWQEARKSGGPELTALALGRPGSVFVDVGANEGLFSLFASALYGRVHSFEPIPDLRDPLVKTLDQRCTIHSVALSDFTGQATFRIPVTGGRLHTQLASLRAFDPETTYRQLEVDVRRLDDFELGAVSFIKIDVEGAEHATLLGAARTIAVNRPVLMVEIEERHTGGVTQPTFDLLGNWGYEPFVLTAAQERSFRLPGRNSLRNAALLLGLVRPSLVSVVDCVTVAHELRRNLNWSLLPEYTNNFIFLPRESDLYKTQTTKLPTSAMPPPTADWITTQLRQNGLIDESWYLAQNPDVASSPLGAAEHYVLHGCWEGRDPNPAFSTDAYLEQHPELIASRINPLWHAFVSDRLTPPATGDRLGAAGATPSR